MSDLRFDSIDAAVEASRSDPDGMLLDVRTVDEYAEGHIPGSINIPLDTVASVLECIPDKDAPLFVHCLSGGRSGKAVAFLKKLGYTQVKNIGGIKVITTTRTDLDAGDLRKLGDFLRDKDPDTVAVLATATESKVTFVAVCGKNAVAKGIRAGDLVRAVSAVAGGKGGGKPDSAMGGGSEVLKIDDALAIVDDFVAEKLGL